MLGKKRTGGFADRRRAVGLTQEALAELVEVERTTIRRWEHGESRPQLWARSKLADALKLSLDDLDALLAASDLPTSKAPGGEQEPTRVAICGSRAAGVNAAAVDQAVAALARFVMISQVTVNHGPVGVGIEVMTYLADRYRPTSLTRTTSLFSRESIVRDAQFVIVVGGGGGTADEIDLAMSLGGKVILFPRSGGTAERFHSTNPRCGAWLAPATRSRLADCDTGEDFVAVVSALICPEGATTR